MKENNFKQTEIGLIPEDWEVVRLGDIIVYKKGKKPRMLSDKWEDGFLPYLTAEFFRTGKPDKFVNVRKEAGIEIVNPEDVVLIWDGSKAGDTFTGLKGVLASTMIKIDVRNEHKVSKKLIYYFLKTKFDILNTKTTGSTIPHVSKTVFENLLVPLPPLSEQRKIARVLDKIQQAIELQDRIIEQAERLKKSLMQKLFTEGLYGEEQKETEIGLIPKSWEVVRLGDIIVYKKGKKPRMLSDKWEDGFLPYLTAEFFRTGKPDKFVNVRKEAGIEIVNPEDVVLIWDGSKAGDTFTGLKGVLASTMIKIDVRNEHKVSKKLIYYFLKTKFDILNTKTTGSTIPHVSKTVFENLLVPLPPLEEQKQIAHILSTVDRKIEVEQKRKQVLKELFKTMLHKLMSGEIRLRDVEI